MNTKSATRTRTASQVAKAEKAAAEKTALMDQLDAFIEEFGDEEGRWLHFSQKYSERNAMLIVMQSPEATDVRGYNAWQDAGRQVRKGEHGIRILAPAGHSDDTEATPATDTTPATEAKQGHRFFRLVSIFDVSQTDPK